MLAAYQCLLAHGALVLLWQSQVPMDSSAQDCASALKNWAFPSPILGLQVPTSLPLRYARTLTTVHTPDFDTLSQRHINALSTRYKLGSQAGCVPPRQFPAASIAGTSTDTALYLLTTKTFPLFYSIIDSLTLETKLIIFHEI